MKKTTISNFFLPLGLLLYFIISSYTLVFTSAGETQNASPPPYSHPFYIGAMQNGLDINYTYTDFFNFNTWHYYTGMSTNGNQNGWPGISSDTVFADINDYKNAVLERIDDNYNAGLFTLSDRPKIEYIAFAQQSDYQCESQEYLSELHNDYYWFYTFRESQTGMDATDNTGFGNGLKGKYCSNNYSTDGGQSFQSMSPGYVVYDLRTNREQINRTWDWHYSIDDGNHQWYVKPRVRIDSSFAANPSNLNKLVCRIEIFDFEGDTIKKVNLKVANFRDLSNNYGGQYIEEYFNLDVDSLLMISDGTLFNPDKKLPWDTDCEVDFRVYWYGQCDMWIDYVRVENSIAEQLFRTNNNWDYFIEDEVEQIANEHPGKIMNFYVEEYEFNMLPAIKYVNEKIKTLSNNTLSLITNLNIGLVDLHLPRTPNHNDLNPYRIVPSDWSPPDGIGWNEWKYYMTDATGQNTFFPNFYPFEGGASMNQKLPNTLNNGQNVPPDPSNGINAAFVSPSEYEEHQNDVMDDQITHGTMKLGDYISREKDVPFYILLQAHMWYQPADNHVLKEPTNEELSMLAGVSIAHGVRGIQWFWYGYQGTMGVNGSGRGLLDFGGSLLTTNAYGQPKAQHLADINATLEKWGPYVMSFNDDDRKVAIYRNETERNSFLSSSYFQDIVTYKPGTYEPPCMDNPGGEPIDYTYECAEDRYLQVASFKNPAEPDHTKYFMIVNRRCAPHIDESSDDNNGGRRKVKVKFKASSLPQAVNWKLIDLDTGTPIVFSKNGGLVDLGPYEPGEGKLYKMMPVATDGGTLVDNEVIDGNITLKDIIFTDGFNLTIEAGSTVSFDTNGMIVAEGGNFISGDITDTEPVTLSGNNTDWKGIKLHGCDTVKIFNTSIEDIKDSSYAVDMFNCKNVEMKHNSFSLDNSGAVRGSYVFSFGFFTPAIVLYDNSVDMGENTMPVFNFNANSASSFPVIMDGCVLNAPSSSSSSAISITNITGGVIKNNEITGYNTSVLALSSSMDFYNNTIISSTSDCIISGSAGSTLGLRPSAGKFTGGENFFSTSHEDANNVEIYGGFFFANDGYNTFDIGDNYDDGKHFTGYFTESEFSPSLEYNCFTEDGNSISPVYDVTWGSGGDPVSFSYYYDCNGGEGAGFSSKTENNYVVYPITEGYNDTIKIRNGSYSLTASDSMFIEMRKRNYSRVISIAEDILENNPDIPEATDAVSKLYLASLRLDSAGSRITPLKSFLEQLILDNGENPGLIKRAFYFIQKCKAALGQYQSAMTGFDDIMNNNPNTYEALVASWDYSATALLLNGGNSGGNRNADLDELDKLEKLYELRSFSDDPDDRNGFSKEEKKQIRTNVIKTFEETRKEEINIINKLKERSDRGDRNAGKELKRRELIQNVIKKRQPNDIYEHINGVSSDIKTIFNATGDNALKNDQNTIPSEYELSQNFPNPFNPVTKIQFALPKDGKVQLVIYDILGREVVKLVNNEFRTAGRYVSEFNGSRLASGVYFYRISVDDANAFDMVKKMVLVK